jgi:hypothetical protein
MKVLVMHLGKIVTIAAAADTAIQGAKADPFADILSVHRSMNAQLMRAQHGKPPERTPDTSQFPLPREEAWKYDTEGFEGRAREGELLPKNAELAALARYGDNISAFSKNRPDFFGDRVVQEMAKASLQEQVKSFDEHRAMEPIFDDNRITTYNRVRVLDNILRIISLIDGADVQKVVPKVVMATSIGAREDNSPYRIKKLIDHIGNLHDKVAIAHQKNPMSLPERNRLADEIRNIDAEHEGKGMRDAAVALGTPLAVKAATYGAGLAVNRVQNALRH